MATNNFQALAAEQGTWFIERRRGAIPLYFVRDADGEMIATQIESEDDARVMAAAPALLEACRNLLAAMDAEPMSGFGTDLTVQLAALRAAIAKATGREQPTS
jgi:hypothetical protein